MSVSSLGDVSESFCGYVGDDEGLTWFARASLVTLAFSQCPDTQVVVSGYSQGAQLVHLAAAQLPDATMSKVSAVVTFGDPCKHISDPAGSKRLEANILKDSTEAVANMDASRVLVICHQGDVICQGGSVILYPHLTYAKDATPAAAFVVTNLNL